MEELNVAFRLLAFSQVLMLGLLVTVHYHSRLARLCSLLLLSVCCYLLNPLVPHATNLVLELTFDVLSTCIPSLIWLLGYWFFRDAQQVPKWLLGYTLIYTGLMITRHEELGFAGVPGNFLFYFVPQAMKLILVLHVIYMVLEGYRTDLVTSRQQLRRPVAAGASLVATIVILVELWMAGHVPVEVELIGAVLMFVLLTVANVWWLRLSSDPLKDARPSEIPQPEDHTEELQRITQLMETERYYATQGITIADLADAVGIAEYKLRKLINQQMGYRNFNQFLNHYRIIEATQRLKTEPELPILTIALDVGFNALSSFNKAFKEQTSKTPSEHRKINA